MRILFIGYSNVLKRKVLPFIHEIRGIQTADIAKFHLQKSVTVEPYKLTGEIYNSYDEAIERSNADIAYISTVNSAHGVWAYNALKKGMHVIVDKPAFLSLDKAQELVALAEQLKLGIAEAVVYPFHPQISKIIDIINKENLNPKHLTVNFSFPPLDPENFRYKKDLGGGAINDLGPYVVSVGRVFFNESPKNLTCLINDFNSKHEVETSFSVLAQYSNGRSMTGNFGFNSEYINRLNIFGEKFYFEINRVFTPPADIENEVLMKINNSSRLIKTEKSNCFINFLQKFIDSIEGGDFSSFSSALIQDAISLNILKKSILRNEV
jgi:NDP-hexose-3-ketoreductase